MLAVARPVSGPAHRSVETMIKYGTIYLDPPWRYRNKRTGGSLRSGAAAHYPTLSEADLCALDIRSRCADAAIVAMWTTQPLLLDGTAHRILAAWDLTPRTMGVWEKTGRVGMGFWLRVQTEYLLICPVGSVRPWRSSERNIYHGPTGRHSEKPAYFRQLLETLRPAAAARAVRPPAHAWLDL